jgi:Arc/MetJ family transcription regulator
VEYCVGMPTNLHIDDKLLTTVMRIGKHKTKREAVNAALEHYRQSMEAEKLIRLFGTIEYDSSHDYKAERRRGTEKALRKAAG